MSLTLEQVEKVLKDYNWYQKVKEALKTHPEIWIKHFPILKELHNEPKS